MSPSGAPNSWQTYILVLFSSEINLCCSLFVTGPLLQHIPLNMNTIHVLACYLFIADALLSLILLIFQSSSSSITGCAPFIDDDLHLLHSHVHRHQ